MDEYSTESLDQRLVMSCFFSDFCIASSTLQNLSNIKKEVGYELDKVILLTWFENRKSNTNLENDLTPIYQFS